MACEAAGVAWDPAGRGGKGRAWVGLVWAGGGSSRFGQAVRAIVAFPATPGGMLFHDEEYLPGLSWLLVSDQLKMFLDAK